MNMMYYIQKILQKVFSKPMIKSSQISKKAAVWNNCLIINSNIGDNSYISDHTNIFYTHIGKFCSIASYCIIGGASHPVDFVSTSPVFLEGRNALHTHFSSISYKPYKETTIGNDVWIGAKCCIRSGVHIADGAVVGMGSVVLKDIGPYEIWAGNPARFIRKRFYDEVIEKLINIEWWNMSNEEIKRVASYFYDPNEMIENYLSKEVSVSNG